MNAENYSHLACPNPECSAYGFFPHRVRTRFETDQLIHGADERIDVRDLAFATLFFRDLALALLGPEVHAPVSGLQ